MGSMEYQAVIKSFEKYNSNFLSLPFKGVRDTGLLLPLFSEHLKECINSKMDPREAVESAFKNALKLPLEGNLPVLFAFLQYIERQIVLFDALEDSFFPLFTPLDGVGTVTHSLKEKSFTAIEERTVRLILTAHPTQFYSTAVLGILRDLIQAVLGEDDSMVDQLLMQLGKTPFQSVRKPTPLDEAESLLWTVSEVFYKTIPKILFRVQKALGHRLKHPLIELGFWPGGDRDGNPFVIAKTTASVLATLRKRVLSHYKDEIELLIRRLTFRGVNELMVAIRSKLQKGEYQRSEELLRDLEEVREILVKEHAGLFLEKLEMFITVVQTFGFHFAHLDIRQDASVHQQTLEGSTSPLAQDTLHTLQTIKEWQEKFGEKAVHRYIISHTTSHQDVLNVISCAELSGWERSCFSMDIVPLFESVDDLRNAPEIFETLFAMPKYYSHLQNRGMQQTVMLGFSDGTKDGGYVTANWEIFQLRHRLYALAKKCGVTLTFFDGRGGPPSRGGGNTHLFYRAVAHIPSDTHLTLQGQTITSKYGTEDIARYNIEQLLTAPLSSHCPSLTSAQVALLNSLSQRSYKKYCTLKDDPLFLPYLQEMTPLPYIKDLNITSRPVARSQMNNLSLDSLRAIPFVASWSQVKQNVPGYYGLGTALEEIGKFDAFRELYEDSLFFRTLINNCNQSLSKTNFMLTQHVKKDKKFGAFWSGLKEEAERTQRAVLAISGESRLLEHAPVSQISVAYRERLVFTTVVLQQYAIMELREEGASPFFEKLLRRTIPSILNAARNSA